MRRLIKFFLAPFVATFTITANARDCGQDLVLVFKDGSSECSSRYKIYRDASRDGMLVKVAVLDARKNPKFKLFSHAENTCGIPGRPAGNAWNYQSWQSNDREALRLCENDLDVARSSDPEKFKNCGCEIVLSAEPIGNNRVKVLKEKTQFEKLYAFNSKTEMAASDVVRQGLEKNTKDIETNRGNISQNRSDIQINREAIGRNAGAIEINRQGIEKNTKDIETNRGNISQNRSDIQINREAIERNTQGMEKSRSDISRNQEQMLSRTTRIDERYQQQGTGSAPSWAIYKAGVPFQQQQFCRITENFRKEMEEAKTQKNQIKENVAFRTREQRLTALMPDGSFSNWIVRAVSVKQAPDGSAAVLFELPCDVVIGSHACGQNAKSFVGTIPENSRLYSELATISVGDFLGVSGTFNFVDEKAAFQKGRSVASFRSMLSDSHCEAKDVAKSGSDFFASSIATLSNLK